MSVVVERGAASSDVASRQVATAIIASSLGWSLDLFDLFILLYVAPAVGKAFFPSEYPTLSLAAVYASFAVTLLMRPVGSALFGSYADKNGRKGAMIVAVIGVGIATAAFGLLPTIDQIGIAAPILFLLLRLVQGVFVGGVVASTHTIGTESVAPKWRGLLSGFVGVGGAGIGSLLASIIYFAVSSVFTGDAFNTWGWRFMFFSGILSSVLGVFIFNALEESPLWKRMDAASSGPRAPLRTLFTAPHAGKLATNLLITTGGGLGYYLTSGYLPSFFKLVNQLPNTTASLLLIAASIMTIIASLLVGHLSEMIGRKMTFILVSAASAVLLPALYLLLAGTTDLTAITAYSLGIAFLGSAGVAPILIFCNERFPTAVRASGTGLSWNIGFALGGTMPALVSWASGSLQGLPVTLAVFLAAGFVLYLIGALLVPETKGQFN
jgi:MHS family proline/betaine transporter-like MFS transporter